MCPVSQTVAVIAGMGGGLDAEDSLSGSPEFFEKNSCVVLQPQSEIEQFRRFFNRGRLVYLRRRYGLRRRKILSDDVL